MLKTNNNKRNITILIGIIVAIAIIFGSFGPLLAEGTSDVLTNYAPKIHFPDIDFHKIVKILSPFNL